jgi:tryptophan synthase alpha chain
MSRIDDIFATLRARNERALMPFITGGHPTLETTTALLQRLGSAGASIVEVGIPFSDPIADGPVIAGAMHEVLEAGTCVNDILAAVAAARPHTDLGIVAMVSESIVHKRGSEAFLHTLAEAGFDGVIVPDLDPSKAPPLLVVADELGLSFSLLAAPNTTLARVHTLAEHSRGFLYLLARSGITGASSTLPNVTHRVEQIRSVTDLPIAAGFGIGTPQQVAAATQACDAAIVGSALVRVMDAADDPTTEALAFVASLAKGLSHNQPR